MYFKTLFVFSVLCLLLGQTVVCDDEDEIVEIGEETGGENQVETVDENAEGNVEANAEGQAEGESPGENAEGTPSVLDIGIRKIITVPCLAGHGNLGGSCKPEW